MCCVSENLQAPYVDGWVSLRDKMRTAVKSGASQVSCVLLRAH